MLWGWYFEESAFETIIYCSQDISVLPNPYDPIPVDGTIIYCSQDTSGLPTV